MIKKGIITEGWVSMDDEGHIDRGNLGIPYFMRIRKKPKAKDIVRVVLITRDEYWRLRGLEKKTND